MIKTHYSQLFFTCLLLCATFAMQAQEVSFTNMGTSLGNIAGQAYEDCAVDMNGDFLDDVVRVIQDQIVIDYQQPDGSFTQMVFDVPTQNIPDWSLCAGDIDGNGYNDLLFGGGSAVSFIYANDNGTAYTEDYHEEYIFAQRSTFADIDNDGDLDAFVCHDVDQSHPYRNDGNGVLTEDQSLIETIDLAGNYAAIWVDYDNDRDTDLYITKCRQGSSPGDIERTNAMYRNNGDGTYTEVAAEINMDDNAQSWATVFEDFDNDGDFDAFIVNHDEANRFMENDGNGVFTEIITTTNIPEGDLGAWENASGDFNNDGFVDIFSELEQELYLNNGDMTFTGYDLPFDDGGIGDFNNDGFLDVVKGNSLWINDGNDNNYVKFNTTGIISNKNGIGARIEIYGAWGVQIREVRSGQSFSPMSSLTVHFGLGTATAIDQVIIKWPSGMLTTLENPAINQTHNVLEADCLLAESILTTSGSTSLCEGSSIQITAPAGFEHYNWSNGATSQTIVVNSAGSYSAVLSTADSCFSLTNKITVEMIVDEIPTIAVDGAEIFCKGSSTTLTASEGLNPVWSNGQQTASIEVVESGTFSVSVDGICSNDPLASESIDITVIETVLPEAEDVSLPEPGVATLMATGDNLEWFDAVIGGMSIGSGPSYETPFLTQGATYYVESHTINGGELQDGGKLDMTGGGGIPGTGAYNYFDVYEPFKILSVTVFLPSNAPAGMRLIELTDADGVVLDSRNIEVTEPQQELELNFDVPVGEDLSLRCSNCQLFRNNGGVEYPYAIGDVGLITNSFYGMQYYYYFYDWKIQKEKVECISDRIPVEVSLLTATEDLNKTLSALTIQPNPANDRVFITLNAIENAEMQINMFDAIGQKVMEEKSIHTVIGSNTTPIDVSTLAKGMYYIQLTANGQQGSWKIVVQ